MKIKYFKYLTKFIIISFFSVSVVFSQIKSVTYFKIVSSLPTHNYDKITPPSFEIKIDATENLRGKLTIKLKSITEKNYKSIFDKRINFKKGINNLILSTKEIKLNSLEKDFYEIYAQFVTYDYRYLSDTLTFAINIDSIKYKNSKPADFEIFWRNTFSKLDSINPNYTIDTLLDKSTEDVFVFKLSFTGFDSMRIRAWYCIPKGIDKSPAIILLPSYGNRQIDIPYNFCKNGFTTLAIQIHGKDVENDTYPTGDDPSAGLNLDNAEKYYLRNAIANIKRAIDFMYSRQEIDTNRIAAVGTSQGGGLALLITGLDPRVKATAATIPTLIHYKEALLSGAYWRVKRAINNNFVDEQAALNTLSYFDAINLLTAYKNPILLSAHYKDRISTPNTIVSFYNHLQIPERHLIIQPELGHEFPQHHWDLSINWLKRIFRME